jgi:hypothetical protein
MRAVLYDCTDHPDMRYRNSTLRVLDERGVVLLQGQVYGAGRGLCERIAAGLGVELQYVGPPDPASPVPAAGDELPPVLRAVKANGGVGVSADPAAAECAAPVALANVKRNSGWLF